MIYTCLTFRADYPKPEPGQSGAGDVAEDLVVGLRAMGFNPSDPEDQVFVHFVYCSSGEHRYEIMIAFDFVGEALWEISCPRRFGFFAKLFGKREDKELSALIQAIHRVVEKNPKVKEMRWHPKYGDKSYSSPHAITTA